MQYPCTCNLYGIIAQWIHVLKRYMTKLFPHIIFCLKAIGRSIVAEFAMNITQFLKNYMLLHIYFRSHEHFEFFESQYIDYEPMY